MTLKQKQEALVAKIEKLCELLTVNIKDKKA